MPAGESSRRRRCWRGGCQWHRRSQVQQVPCGTAAAGRSGCLEEGCPVLKMRQHLPGGNEAAAEADSRSGRGQWQRGQAAGGGGSAAAVAAAAAAWRSSFARTSGAGRSPLWLAQALGSGAEPERALLNQRAQPPLLHAYAGRRPGREPAARGTSVQLVKTRASRPHTRHTPYSTHPSPNPSLNPSPHPSYLIPHLIPHLIRRCGTPSAWSSSPTTTSSPRTRAPTATSTSCARCALRCAGPAGHAALGLLRWAFSLGLLGLLRRASGVMRSASGVIPTEVFSCRGPTGAALRWACWGCDWRLDPVFHFILLFQWGPKRHQEASLRALAGPCGLSPSPAQMADKYRVKHCAPRFLKSFFWRQYLKLLQRHFPPLFRWPTSTGSSTELKFVLLGLSSGF